MQDIIQNTEINKKWLNNCKSLFSVDKDIEELKFFDLWYDYEKNIKLNLKYQSYIKTISKFKNHILPYFKDFKVVDIDHRIYLSWKIEIENKGLKYKTLSSIHTSMVSILNYAMKYYNLKCNIASKVGNFKKNKSIKKNINFWTIEEFNKFIQVVDNDLYKLFFETLFRTGIRQGECLALTWNDFNDDHININKTISKTKVNGEYVINSPKTESSYRIIKIDNILKELLKKEYEQVQKEKNFNKNSFIFGGTTPLAPTTIGRKKEKYCNLANVKKIRIHDFRHSHASLLISQGVPITVISQRLGHTDIYMTLNTYSHLIPKDEDKAIAILNSI